MKIRSRKILRLFLVVLLGLLQGCSGVFYQPSKHEYTKPEQFKLKYEDVWFKAKDGTNIHGRFFPAKTEKVKGTIVQFHGNAQNLTTHFFSLIWLIEQGYNLFTWDYRGYGRSEGEPSQVGIYLDSFAALDKARELHRDRGLFVVYGQSLGGAIALRVLPDWSGGDLIDLVVHDSSFHSYQDIAFEVLKSRWFLWPFSPLAYVLVSDEYAAEKVLEKIHWPTLVIVGEKDAVIPAKSGKETYDKIKSDRKWLWDLPEGEHINVFHHAEGHYRKQFLDLLEQLRRK